MSGPEPRGGDISPIRQPRQCRTHSIGLPARSSLPPEPPPLGANGVAPPIPRRHSAAPAVAPPPIPLRAPAIPARSKNERPIPVQSLACPKPRLNPEPASGSRQELENRVELPSVSKRDQVPRYSSRLQTLEATSWSRSPDEKRLPEADQQRGERRRHESFEDKDFAAEFERGFPGVQQQHQQETERRPKIFPRESGRPSNLEELRKASRDLERRLCERLNDFGGQERSKFVELQQASRDLERKLLEKTGPGFDEIRSGRYPEVEKRLQELLVQEKLAQQEKLLGAEHQQRSRYDADMEKARNMLSNNLRRDKSNEKLEKLPKATQTNLPPPLSSIVQSPVQKPVSVRQDSNVSSDSFSQTSSPSYTSKTMEAPLLPHKHINGKVPGRALAPEPENPPGSPITKSMSTPASLQAIVRFHSGSNMSLHHRIIRDIRRPSSHYATRRRLRFRSAQVLVNAVALLAIAGGLAAYFKSYPAYTVRFENRTVYATEMIAIQRPPTVEPEPKNPAPGICLPVIVSFCQYHKIPYNFTVFPNYMGNFGQRDAQHELELYDAIVDVRCYELAALFLCSVFVPKCGTRGQVVRPCRSLCSETKRRCGFFLKVFELTLPDYLECDVFPENSNPDLCVGHREVNEAAKRAERPVCVSGFRCDATRCIPMDWKCDGHVDCADQSDEIGCAKCESTIASPTRSETGLSEPVLHCGETRCMSSVHVCDGVMDCPWGQDERNCLRLSERNGDAGRGRLEIFHGEKGSFSPVCVMQWDNVLANEICSFLGYAVAVNSSFLLANGSKMTTMQQMTNATTGWQLTRSRSRNLMKQLRQCTEYAIHPTVELSCSEYSCGKRRLVSGNSRDKLRIVGGTESAPGDWPFLAALLGGPEEVFYCAGVLIADQWVLTASHCVGKEKSGSFSHSDVSGWTIQLGITRRHAHTYLGQKVKVKRVVPHPNYNLGVAHDNDVALFQLEKRVQFHEHLRPVCLPKETTELIPGKVCTVIGWGKKEDTDASEYEPAVNEVNVPVLDRKVCNEWLEHKELNITEGMICAGYLQGGKDACQGDSGGPLLCRDPRDKERWFVGGIVSWGIKCAHPKLPGVYAYVPRYVRWIREQMALYAEKDDM